MRMKGNFVRKLLRSLYHELAKEQHWLAHYSSVTDSLSIESVLVSHVCWLRVTSLYGTMYSDHSLAAALPARAITPLPSPLIKP